MVASRHLLFNAQHLPTIWPMRSFRTNFNEAVRCVACHGFAWWCGCDETWRISVCQCPSQCLSDTKSHVYAFMCDVRESAHIVSMNTCRLSHIDITDRETCAELSRARQGESSISLSREMREATVTNASWWFDCLPSSVRANLRIKAKPSCWWSNTSAQATWNPSLVQCCCAVWCDDAWLSVVVALALA